MRRVRRVQRSGDLFAPRRSKEAGLRQGFVLVGTGAPPGTRTPNPRIKSPLPCVSARPPASTGAGHSTAWTSVDGAGRRGTATQTATVAYRPNLVGLDGTRVGETT